MQAEKPPKSKTSSTGNFALSDTDKQKVVDALRVFDNSSTFTAGALTFTSTGTGARPSSSFSDVGAGGSTTVVVQHDLGKQQVDELMVRLKSAEEVFAAEAAAYGVVSHRVMSRLACVGKMLQEGTLDSKGTKLMQVADACRCNPYGVKTKKTKKMKMEKTKTRFRSTLTDPLFEQARLMAFCAWRLSRKSKLGPKLRGERSLAGARSPVVYSYERSKNQLEELLVRQP